MPKNSRPDNQPASPKRRRFLQWIAGATLLGTGATAAYGERVEANDLQVVHQDIAVAGWPAGTPPLRVGQLSDLHCDRAAALARARRAAEMLRAQRPDVVFLTGDYISEKPLRWAAPAAQALAPLTAVPGGVFCILGNHDWTNFRWRPGDAGIVARALSEVGFTVLRNDAAPLPQAPGVWLIGLDDRFAGKQDVARALRDVLPGACKILLVHEPDYADEAPPGFALQLSGHSHGGQIRLPGLPPLHVPKYSTHYPEGLQQGPHHPIYTTRGIGMIGPQMRLFCPPEVTVLNLHAA
ncbi:MAG: metallophosphoesterase [Armatimonadetes bacterium]|nr:metallophosphoesterase [Armatimonadota bacterium]